MFERDRSYPTAITGDDFENAELDAIAWAAKQQKIIGGTILIYVPTKASLHDSEGPLAQMAKLPGVVVATPKTGIYGWSGGPVIAAWPTRESLAQLADQRRVKALCVIPWVPEYTSAWQQAANPEMLGTAKPPAANECLDPVVAVGLKHLTRVVNHANNLAGGLDHRDAVAVLRELHRGGYRLPPDAVYAFALAHGWPGRGAGRLRELASQIDAGKAVRLQGPSPLRSDILQRWRDEAAA